MLTIFPHGKYENKSVAEVRETDPAYLIWWSKNEPMCQINGDDIFIASCRLKVRENDQNI